MMNLFILICMLFLAFISYKLSRDVLSPPCVLSLSWALPFLFLILSEGFGKGAYDIDYIALYFVLGVFVFIIGYFIANNRYSKKLISFNNISIMRFSIFMKLFILLEVLLTFYFLYDVYSFVMTHYQYNFWFTYKWNVSMGFYSDPVIIEYLRAASRIFLCIMFINLLSSKAYNKDKKWIFLQFFVTFVLNFLGQGRGALFNLFIPLFIIFIMMRRKSNSDIIKTAIFAFLLLIVVFVIYDFLKNPYIVASDRNIFSTFENYLCGGVVAFVNWVQEKHEYFYGAYTFRFFFAILHSLGFDVTVVSMVEPYVYNINDNIGNVYTFYKWYANDFGLFYAIVWQFIIGMIHGFITKKTFEKRSIFMVVLYALSFYPLVMQFFMDEYVTMLSIWIQTFFWLFVILKTNIFYVKNEEGVV